VPLHTTLINSNVTLERSVSACQSVCVLLLAVGGWRADSRRCRPIYPHGDGFIVCCGPGGGEISVGNVAPRMTGQVWWCNRDLRGSRCVRRRRAPGSASA